MTHFTKLSLIGAFAASLLTSVTFAGQDADMSLKGWAHKAGSYISGKMTYPQMAIQKNEEGAPVFHVTVDREGKVLSAKMTERSWGSTINRAAKRAIKKADFPDLPANFEGDKLTFALTMRYAIADSAYEYRKLQNAGSVSTEQIAETSGPLTASIEILNMAE